MSTESDYKAWLKKVKLSNVKGNFIINGFQEIQYSSKEEAERAFKLMSKALSF